MSELREHLFVPYSELQEGDELTDAITIAKSYYLKSDADKVIAEKDKEIAELKERVSEERLAKVNYKISANDLSDGLKEAYAEINHHKYKRCLAMAKRCKDLHDHYKAEYDCDEGFGDGMLRWIRWATKWQKRWLAIAEEFKEAGK